MFAVHPAFHLGAYHFAHGTFQPASTGSALGCAELDSLLGGGPPAGHRVTGGLLGGPRQADLNASVDLNAALDVCFDAQFSCSHAEVHSGSANEGTSLTLTWPCAPTPTPTLKAVNPDPNPKPNPNPNPNPNLSPNP